MTDSLLVSPSELKALEADPAFKTTPESWPPVTRYGTRKRAVAEATVMNRRHPGYVWDVKRKGWDYELFAWARKGEKRYE